MLNSDASTIADNNKPGVYPLTHGQDLYWVKVAGENKSNVVRKISAQIAKFNAFSFFQTNAVQSAYSRFTHEKNILLKLVQLDLPVAKILAYDERYFVTENAGVMLKKLSPELITQALIVKIFTSYGYLHQHDVAHGRPALRDIMIRHDDEGDHVILIDFEESIEDANAQLKARDMFLLLMDMGRLSFITTEQKLSALLEWKKLVDDNVWQTLVKMTRTFSKLTFLAKLVLIIKPKNSTSIYILEAVEVLKKATQ